MGCGRRLGRFTGPGRVHSADQQGGEQRCAEGNNAGQRAGHFRRTTGSRTRRGLPAPHHCQEQAEQNAQQAMGKNDGNDLGHDHCGQAQRGGERQSAPRDGPKTATHPRPLSPGRGSSLRPQLRRGGSQAQSQDRLPNRSGIASSREFHRPRRGRREGRLAYRHGPPPPRLKAEVRPGQASRWNGLPCFGRTITIASLPAAED